MDGLRDLIDSLTAAMDLLENPVAVSNSDGSSDVVDHSSGCRVDDISDKDLEEFFNNGAPAARYGDEKAFDRMRFNRRPVVSDNKLFL